MDRSQSLSVPPHFDGNNYAYWKVRMRAFLKSLDERVWSTCVKGWSAPVTVSEGVGTSKDVSTWSAIEMGECNWNSKGLHSIFMAVSADEFKRISMCETSKEAWDILEITHEGTKTVKNSKLQMLTTKFEEIRMNDDETFDEFYAKLNDIVNSSYNLGERILESRIVRKVMRSLPERFRPKVTAIEESKDLDTMKIEELVGSLQTYEQTLPQPKKNKSIALRSSTSKQSVADDSDEDDLDDAQIAMFVKQFKKFLKPSRGRREYNKGPERIQRSSSGLRHDKQDKSMTNDSRTNKMKCFECQGFGHVRTECPTYLKSKGKALNVTLSDDESNSSDDDSSEDEQVNYMAFMANADECVLQDANSEMASSEDESNAEESLQEVYDKLYRESLNLLKVNKKTLEKLQENQLEKDNLAIKLKEYIKLNDDLKQRNLILDAEVKNLECKLEKSNAQLQQFSSGSKKLDHMLNLGASPGNRRGLGYNESSGASTSKTTFVPASLLEQPPQRKVRAGKKAKSKSMNVDSHTAPPKAHTSQLFVPTCHFCGKRGHIKPNCFKLQAREHRHSNSFSRTEHSKLENQVKVLTKHAKILNAKLVSLTKNSSTFKKVWVRKDASQITNPKGIGTGSTS